MMIKNESDAYAWYTTLRVVITEHKDVQVRCLFDTSEMRLNSKR